MGIWVESATTMPATQTTFHRHLRELRDSARRRHQRQLIIASGSAAWCREHAATVLAAAPGDTLWVGDEAPAAITPLPAEQSRAALGREVDRLVFDAHCGFDPDAFGATLGTVRGGGLVVLLTPAVALWSRFADPQLRRIAVAGYDPATLGARYIERLIRILRDDDQLWWLEENTPLPEPPASPASAAKPATPATPPCRTPDQAQAVEVILRTATGAPRRPVVLTADRGRGKSAAMGIAAARLIREHHATVVVTAPRRVAAQPVFERCEALGASHAGGGRLVFLPPDELVRHHAAVDLVLVDEAAGIPAPLLAQILVRFPRIAFATTVHGYEGTGRGFALRFQRLLDRETPQWQAVALQTPIRWAADDPVEALSFRALLMDAQAAPDAALDGTRPEECPVEFIDRDRLAEDESLLRELFGLLVNAHYRTTPLDLRHLLDGPNIRIAVQRHRGHVAATALVAREGGFDAATAHAIWCGRRRPHGHLLAQSLAAYLGIEEGPQLLGARILRIAVHPALQRRGFGRYLVTQLCQASQHEGLDYLGSSFGATPELMRFWSACGCHTIRIGHRREASSGQHSALVLRPLSERGRDIDTQARERYRRSLHVALDSTLADLERELKTLLLEETTPLATTELDEQDWRDLVAFAFALRGYESAQPAIERFVIQTLSDPKRIAHFTPSDVELLKYKVVQRHGWNATVKVLGLAGRRECQERIRGALRALLNEQTEDRIRQLISSTTANSH